MFAGLSLAAHAQALPPAVLHCAQEQDALKRLECYDKAVANSGGQASAPAAPRSRTESAASPSAAVLASPPAPAPVPSPPAAAQQPRHISSRIRSIRPFPDNVIVTLENGQVWEQVQASDSALNLQPGQSVSIDRQLGDYWLSVGGREAVKVRERP
jgi:3-oxoacyl-ACP reductase-like protein